jgi:YYY domain-containing protein
MFEVFIWWLIFEVYGLAALPLLFAIFRRLPDRGYAFAKIAGFLLVSYLSWVLSISGFFRFSGGLVALALGLVALASTFIAVSQRDVVWTELKELWTHRRATIVAAEGVFAVAYAAAVALRAYSPQIAYTEKPMDFAFVNAILRSGALPPHDPWLSGYPINYYYFGHFSVASTTALSGVPSSIAFNLAIAALFALTALGAYGLGFNLVAIAAAKRTPIAEAPRRTGRLGAAPYGFGLLAAGLVAFVGNLDGGFHFLSSPGTVLSQSWWEGIGWNSSRIIVDTIGGQAYPTINEFPSFSFILADLHPHVMALPLTLLALAIALEVICRDWRDREAIKWSTGNVAFFLLAGITLGGLYFANTWDFPTYFVVVALALFLSLWHARDRKWSWSLALRLAQVLVPLLVLSLVLYAPFHLTFTSLVGSATMPLPPDLAQIPLLPKIANIIGIDIWDKTSLGDFLTIFGLFLFVLVVFLAAQAYRGWQSKELSLSRDHLLVWTGVIVVFVALAVLFHFPLLGLAPVIILGVVVLLRRFESPAASFALLLALGGMVLILGCEMVFLQDVFHDRMNTIFKFYYQTWVLFGVATSFGAWWVLRNRDFSGWLKGARLVWGVGLVVLVGLSLVYPIVSARAKSDDFVAVQGLDGASYLQAQYPGDYEAINWLQANVAGEPIILEATGPAYSDYSRVSAYTGLPTVLGWANHENQWRGGQPSAMADIPQRAADVATIYDTTDANLAESLLSKYRVEYVYVGTLERSKPGGNETEPPSAEALAKFADFMDVVYDKDGVTIYRSR